jgi:hypothetical protein
MTRGSAPEYGSIIRALSRSYRMRTDKLSPIRSRCSQVVMYRSIPCCQLTGVRDAENAGQRRHISSTASSANQPELGPSHREQQLEHEIE